MEQRGIADEDRLWKRPVVDALAIRSHACPFTVTAVRDGSTLTGTFAAFNCAVVDTGTISLVKQ